MLKQQGETTMSHTLTLLSAGAAALAMVAAGWLFLNGVEVGRTPWVAPNTYPRDTDIQARIVYPGAVDWTGTFPGGVSTTFTAELQSAALQQQ